MMEVPIYRNQSIDFESKLVDWFPYDRDLGHERVKTMIFEIFWNNNMYIETNETT